MNRHLPASPRSISIAAATTTLLICLSLATSLAIIAKGPNTLAPDLAISRAVQQLDGPVWRGLAMTGNALGSTRVGLISASLGILIAVRCHRRTDAIFLADLTLLRVAGSALKPLVRSPRPPAGLVEQIGHWAGSGFPSGHSMTAMTIWAGLAVLAWRYLPMRWAIVFAFFAGEIIFIVGFGRVWSGAHWPTDVLSGYAVGLGIVCLGLLLTERRYQMARR